MSTKYSSQMTKALASPQQLIEQGDVAGRVHLAYAEYDLAGDLAAGDVIKMLKLPQGARVVDVILASADLDASGGTLDVGWEANGTDAADQDGFLAVVDVTSAITTNMLAASENGAGHFVQFSAETQVSITTVGDTDATSGKIKLAVLYALD